LYLYFFSHYWRIYLLWQQHFSCFNLLELASILQSLPRNYRHPHFNYTHYLHRLSLAAPPVSISSQWSSTTAVFADWRMTNGSYYFWQSKAYLPWTIYHPITINMPP
jgi:hypothetical protein